MMRRFFLSMALALSCAFVLDAQTTAEEYSARYDLLLNKLGPTGVGIETLIEKWENDFPDDKNMLVAKFSFYLSKSQSVDLELKDADKYLGMLPALALQDSLGNPLNYFQVVNHDDDLFSIASQTIDKAIKLYPTSLELRFYKITSLLNYEGESPDMATLAIKSLIDYHVVSHPLWTYGDSIPDDDFFCTAIQEYCYTLFSNGTPSSLEAFKSISEKMTSIYPQSVLFLDNLGSYYLVNKDNKTANKYFTKALKLDETDNTAIKNSLLIARSDKNVKLEKKYLQMLSRFGESETDRESAKIRLQALSK